MRLSLTVFVGLNFLLGGGTISCFAQQGTIQPSPPIRVFHADSEEERQALNEDFVGITYNDQLVSGLFPVKATGVSTAPVKQAVEAFLASLDEDERAQCSFPVDDPEWRRWSNIDISLYKRKGIGLEDLSLAQKELALQILRESLSAKGFQKAQDIMKMEQYLARLTHDFEHLGAELYWFTFMGEPSDTEPWGWQMDGHHLVINFFVLGDQVVMTPTFMGSEPSAIAEGEHAGTRTFEEEVRLGLKMYNSLDTQQKALTTLRNRKNHSFIQAEAFRDNADLPTLGIKATALNDTQLLILQELIETYVGNIREGHSQIRMEEVLEHLNDTYFAWVGAQDGSGPFYYRIQSPVIHIEFDHQRPVALRGNKPTRRHVHTVVRTPNGNDYGKDLLRQHLEQHHDH